MELSRGPADSRARAAPLSPLLSVRGREDQEQVSNGACRGDSCFSGLLDLAAS